MASVMSRCVLGVVSLVCARHAQHFVLQNGSIGPKIAQIFRCAENKKGLFIAKGGGAAKKGLIWLRFGILCERGVWRRWPCTSSRLQIRWPCRERARTPSSILVTPTAPQAHRAAEARAEAEAGAGAGAEASVATMPSPRGSLPNFVLCLGLAVAARASAFCVYDCFVCVLSVVACCAWISVAFFSSRNCFFIL